MKHLSEFVEKASNISSYLDKSFKNNLSDSVVAASNLAENKEDIGLVFHIARNKLRNRIYNSSTSREARILSNKLVKIIETEKLMRERSLNTGIQLASVL